MTERLLTVQLDFGDVFDGTALWLEVAVRPGDSGGAYTLGGTLGQPDAGLMTGGDYALGGGFWGGGATAVAKHKIYLPLVQRDA